MARLLVDLKEYLRPETVREAVDLITTFGSSGKVLAGGTSLAFSKPKISAAIDISRLPCRGCASTGDGLEIGAVTTIREMETDPLAQEYAGGILCQASDKLASTPLRNLITVGGNLMGGYSWSDLPVVFLTLDASIRYVREEPGIKSIDIDGQHQRSKLLESNELITHIVLPANRQSSSGVFLKYSRTETDFAMVSVAVSLNHSGGRMSDIRIACGGLVGEPQRIMAAETMLEGSVLSDSLLEKTGAAAAETITPRNDYIAGAEYRLSVLSTLVQRAVRAAVKG
jgi:CO/xanthine dehydrogenase FAD-binding subunit